MGRDTNPFVDFVSGLVAGLTIGYAASLLFAPQEGAESRARLAVGAEALRDAPRTVLDEVQARLHRAVEEGRQAAEDARAELEAAAGLRPAAHPDDDAAL